MGEEACHRLRCGRRGARASFLPGPEGSNEIVWPPRAGAGLSCPVPAARLPEGRPPPAFRGCADIVARNKPAVTDSPFSRGKTMRKKKVHAIAIKSFALLVVLGTAYQARSQDATAVSEDGPGRPIPHDRSGCGNSSGAKRSTGVHCTRCRGTGSWT